MKKEWSPVLLIAMFLFTDVSGQSGESASKQVIINSREKRVIPLSSPVSSFPRIAWISPATGTASTDFPDVDISGLIQSESAIRGVVALVNGQPATDNSRISFVPTGNLNEYRFSGTVALSGGTNELKIEVTNEAGRVTSVPRIINYSSSVAMAGTAGRRLALIIGNSNYVYGNTLQNPVNDANSMSQILSSLGFTVLKYLNADQKVMRRAMDEFGERLRDYDVGLFFYAGHGIQVKGNNYLIPVDAALKIEQDVEYDCIDAGRLLGKMEAAGTSTNIVILDACRNNPFERSWAGRSQTQGNGLAFMNAPSGSIIAYSTSPGKTASDGSGVNSTYTEALLRYITVPGMTIEEFFKSVRTMVESMSNRTQTPWESTSLKGNFYFKPK